MTSQVDLGHDLQISWYEVRWVPPWPVEASSNVSPTRSLARLENQGGRGQVAVMEVPQGPRPGKSRQVHALKRLPRRCRGRSGSGDGRE